MRVLITGIAGFVGNHLIKNLITDDSEYGLEIMGADIDLTNFLYKNHDGKNISIHSSVIDLRDRDAVEKIIMSFKPDIIYHLAAQSSVSYSWEKPVETFEINVFGGINILESVREYCSDCKILVTCTAEEYAEPLDVKDSPIDEDFRIRPKNPYAISKSALDFFSTTYQRAYDLFVYVTRSFNHAGPGQSERFVISDFAKQIAEIEKGIKEPVISVGNIDVYRDFLDVRDVISAYRAIIDRGRPGEVYNVCSGIKTKISDILELLVSSSTVKKIEIKVDENKLRPVELIEVYGDNRKLKLDTGWKPNYNIRKSILDILNWWRKKKGA